VANSITKRSAKNKRNLKHKGLCERKVLPVDLDNRVNKERR